MNPGEVVRREIFRTLGEAPRYSTHETAEFWGDVANAGLEAARWAYREGERREDALMRAAGPAMCKRFWSNHPRAAYGSTQWCEGEAEELERNWWPASAALLAAAKADKQEPA